MFGLHDKGALGEYVGVVLFHEHSKVFVGLPDVVFHQALWWRSDANNKQAEVEIKLREVDQVAGQRKG